MVPNTRWPVSAAWMAASKVSTSRSSPTRMTSGSCRTASLSALCQSHHVQADLALVDVRLLVGEGELDRVLDGEDVQRLAFGDVVEHGGDGGALAGAGDAGQDDQAFGEVAQLLDAVGQAEVLEAGDDGVDAAGDQRQPAALLEEADAEAAFVLADDVGEVHAAFLVEDLAVAFGLSSGSSSRSMSSWRQRPHVHAADVALEPHHGRLADLEVQVGRLHAS